MSDKTICTTCLRLRQGYCDGEKELTACPSYKRMTNADRIRAMTDEELALYLVWTSDPDTLIVDYRLYECHDRSVEDALNWLKQEVSDNG